MRDELLDREFFHSLKEAGRVSRKIIPLEQIIAKTPESEVSFTWE